MQISAYGSVGLTVKQLLRRVKTELPLSTYQIKCLHKMYKYYARTRGAASLALAIGCSLRNDIIKPLEAATVLVERRWPAFRC